jgi:hypothetical protein
MAMKLTGLLFVAVWLAFTTPSSGQTFGQITGLVTDPSGAVVVGAPVTVTNPQTGFTRAETTNASGIYTFPNLLPGLYNVKVESQGFQAEIRSGVELQVEQTARLDFQLQVGTVALTLDITTGAPLLNTEDATVGTVIENQRIVDLPLNGRNFLQLVALSPNVSASFANGGQSSARLGGDRSAQQLSISGNRREWNYFTLDGMDNTDVDFNSYLFLPSIDALQEFKVQTGIYSAEFGREIRASERLDQEWNQRLSRHGVGVHPQQRSGRSPVRLHGQESHFLAAQMEPVWMAGNDGSSACYFDTASPST